MTYFLENIAKNLYAEFGNSLNRHCLVFPSRRAGLYFLKYLAAGIDKPVWSPSIMTINELFRSFSSLQSAGNEMQLFELYKVYRKLKQNFESFDDFYYWGDMLLGDFDDVDKYLVDPSLLFMNIRDIREIDTKFGGLTDAQISIIRKFWTNFNADNQTREKSGFIDIWSILNELYNQFRTSLKDRNLAYEGMIFREVAESDPAGYVNSDRWDLIHFIGFNALNECEKKLMSTFRKAGKARFYWDYDNSYIKTGLHNSAGYFIRENLERFGNDMPAGWSYDSFLTSERENVSRKVIETSSDLAQVKLITGLLKVIPGLAADNAHHTAVVLADENLLMPVLTSLPEDMGDINITMGHPLKQTIVYTLVRHLMDLQKNAVNVTGRASFIYSEVLTILKHPLLNGLLKEKEIELEKQIINSGKLLVEENTFNESGILSLVFKKHSSPSELSGYFKEILSLIASHYTHVGIDNNENLVQSNIVNEFIYRIVLSINRLEPIVESGEVSFTGDTYIRILDRMLRMQSVPFSGEPLSGIQIMGILETRVLDFKNLIILSANEGVLPSVTSGSSFIPFSLREAFGLPSVNHQESIFAYHFYRLLQRAENVTMIYNSNSEGMRTGEMSRFLLQMKYDKKLKPDFINLDFEIKSSSRPGERVGRTEDHQRKLQNRYLDPSASKPLSPTAINMWLNCRMKFLYRYIYDLKEFEDISQEIDPAMLGTILHDVMKRMYEPFINRAISPEFFSQVIDDPNRLMELIDNSFIDNYKAGREGLISGSELIVREVLKSYILRILRHDKFLAPLSVISLEKPYSFSLNIDQAGVQCNLKIGGNVDRIDSASGIKRIVDYKTGKVSENIKAISDLFEDDRKKEPDGWLQTLIYCEAYLNSSPQDEVRPAVYRIKNLGGDDSDDRLHIKSSAKNEIIVESYSAVREEFLSGLNELVSTIFSSDEPFIMTEDSRAKCTYCPYRQLCMR